ncbi:MAG: TonB-dependent siderophore receptor [Cereibacter sphaeroides]|uniref:TonB-dependent siderophore receptor n=1 Tax=Cereibacter sphaeroides TaxID=1063 RepID=A0A2W5SH13_CERSP|nr:MAG: TonB-dependent siderophore receptor [Cereibacter sphaeroides]
MTLFRRPSRIALLAGHTALIACTLPLMAYAQDSDTTTTVLEEINVTGGGSATGPVTSADPNTLTGSKTSTPITEIPQSVSVIGDQEIQQTNARKIDGVLGYTAGVLGQPYGLDTDTNWVFIRGFPATATGAFLDQLQLFSYAFGGFYIDPFLLERVEILKGPSSVLYGGSNPGGILNYVSKVPTGVPGSEAEIGINETGGAWGSFDTNGVTQGGGAFRFSGKLESVDGNGAFEGGYHGILGAGFTSELDDGSELTFLLNYTNIDEDHVGGAWLPYEGTVEAAPFGYIDREFNTGEPAVDWYKRDQVMATVMWNKDFGNWKLSNTTRFAWSDVDESSVYAYGYAGYSPVPTDPENNLSRIFFQQTSETTGLLSDTRAETVAQTGAVEHTLLFGLDMRAMRLDQTQASVAWPDAATMLSVTNPIYGAPQPATTPYIDQQLDQKQVGLYFQDQMRWGNGWIATFNARLDYVQTETGVNKATDVDGMTRDDTEPSWRLGLAKTMDNGVTPYVTASTYFNPQVVTDINGANVSPETGDQVEAGVKWSPNPDTLLTIAAFQINRKNISQSLWTGFGYDYQQIGEVRSSGLEIEGQSRIAEGVVVRGAITKMNVEITDDIDETLIGMTPYATIEDQVSLKVDWSPASVQGLTLTGGVRYLGSSWADNLNTQKVPDVTLFDAGATYAFADGWSANLWISNLTDETYVASCQTNLWCFYGEGRNASLAIRKTF